MATSEIEKVLAVFRDSVIEDIELAGRTLISGLLLGVVLTINAYGQPPSTPAPTASAKFCIISPKNSVSPFFTTSPGRATGSARRC